jgi:hypothetical protein
MHAGKPRKNFSRPKKAYRFLTYPILRREYAHRFWGINNGALLGAHGIASKSSKHSLKPITLASSMLNTVHDPTFCADQLCRRSVFHTCSVMMPADAKVEFALGAPISKNHEERL